MPKQNRWIAALGFTAIFTLLTVMPARAQFVEPGDAGQTLATASGTGVPNSTLTSITGTISSATDADLYVIRITSTTMFSAIASSISGIDTSLFLFNSSGMAVIANDDSSGMSFQAAIPSGNSLLTSLSPGIYYLGISLSGNEPINLNSQLLFTVDQPTTNVRGPASGLNPTTLSTFNGNTYFSESGAYTITLSATQAAQAVPEPSTWAILILGAAFLGFVLHRRCQLDSKL